MNNPSIQAPVNKDIRRFIADGISATNLACGIASMVFAYNGMLPLSLLMLLIGGVLDGLDGAAARKWGGTRFGVLSDDIADGVNYGIAPGFAAWVSIGGAEGLAVGLAFVVFTIGRLVYFTLNKEGSDPGHFAGVPSTVGGIVTLCALILFPDKPAVVGLLVGAACALMVSFDTLHRHLGRLILKRARWMGALPVIGLALSLAGIGLGPKVPATIILASSLMYGFLPTMLHFARAVRRARRKKKKGSSALMLRSA